jgi:hypothetical protein
VLFSVLGARFDASLTDAGVPEQTRTQLVAAVKDSAGAIIPSLAADPATAAIAEDAKQALTDATRFSAATASGFLVVGLLASLSLGERRRRED